MTKLTVKKPWGQFDQFTHNEESTVKILSVKPDSSLSLQYHKNRTEFWRVLSGHPLVTVESSTTKANPGDEFMIGEMQHHKLEAEEDEVSVLEIATGDFDEEDIIRLEDKYGRA